MASLQTQFMGLTLNNPVIVSSSGITGSIRGIKKCAETGAGAVVLKSMFEELIIAQADNLDHELVQSEHPEAYDYIRAQLGMQIGPRPYLKFIEDVKSHVDIPVIASVNCSTPKWWVPYSQEMADAGADALELNISHFPSADIISSQEIEDRYVDIVKEVTAHVSIPVAVKVGYYFTSLENVMERIVEAGANALVLFNRYYTVDIDLDKKQFTPSMSFSSPQDMALPLRWVGLLSDNLECDIAASTGIHDGESAIKMLLAGANAVQLCSVLYERGTDAIAEIIEDIDTWLEKNCYDSVNDIRGLAIKNSKSTDLLARLQYLRALENAAKYEE